MEKSDEIKPLLQKEDEISTSVSSDENDSAETQSDCSLNGSESNDEPAAKCEDEKEVEEEKDNTNYHARLWAVAVADIILTAIILKPNMFRSEVCTVSDGSHYFGMLALRMCAIFCIIFGLKRKNHWVTFASFVFSVLVVPCWIVKSQFLLFSDQWLALTPWVAPCFSLSFFVLESYWIFYFWHQMDPEEAVKNKDQEKDMKDASASLVIKKFIQFCSPYYKESLICFVSILIQQVAKTVLPLIQAQIVNDVISNEGKNLVKYFSWCAVWHIVQIVTHYFHAYYQRYLRIVLERDMRISVYEKVLQQETGYFDLNTTGETTSVVFHKVDRASCDFAWYMRCVFEDVTRSIVTIIAAICISPRLTLANFMFSPCVVVGFAYFNRHSRRLNTITDKMWKDMERITTEAIQNIRTVKLFACSDFELEEYHRRVKGWVNVEIEKCFFDEARWAWCSFVPSICYMFILYFGLMEVVNSNLTVGSLVAFLQYNGTLTWMMESWGSKYSRFVRLMVQSTKVFRLMERESKLQRTADIRPDTCKGKIELSDVTMCYPKTPEVETLKKLNLDIQPGEIVALVGESGGGKSSICKAMTFSYGMSNGEVKLDGRLVSDYNKKWFANRMTIVPQDSELFARTIAENISYGLENCSLKEIKDAAKKANAHDFITSFKDGYNTILGERGVTLSGGQKQRVSIARALVRKPNVLLLDEATASLDTKSERKVHKAIDDLFEKKEHNMSMMIIAHRLSTVMHADKICVIKGGAVVEVGSHDTLLKKDGFYASLVREQSLFKTKESKKIALKKET